MEIFGNGIFLQAIIQIVISPARIPRVGKGFDLRFELLARNAPYSSSNIYFGAAVVEFKQLFGFTQAESMKPALYQPLGMGIKDRKAQERVILLPGFGQMSLVLDDITQDRIYDAGVIFCITVVFGQRNGLIHCGMIRNPFQKRNLVNTDAEYAHQVFVSQK